jgi:hypothetical protein
MGDSTPKGEARGGWAYILPERDHGANQTLIGQSTASGGNKTKRKTVLSGRV